MGGGATGNGRVGESHSPGPPVCGTGRSSTGRNGSPVSRFRTKTKPIFVTWATTSCSAPSRQTEYRPGCAGTS